MAIKISGTTVIDQTQKILQPSRVTVATTATSLAPNTDNVDQYNYTALATSITISADTGTGQVDGQRLSFRFTPTASNLTISFATGATKTFRFLDVAVPTVTTANKTIYVGCIWSVAASRWDIVSASIEV